MGNLLRLFTEQRDPWVPERPAGSDAPNSPSIRSVRPDYDVMNDVPHNAEINIVLCGNTMTGKRSLINCYESDVFDPFPDPTIMNT